jgi:copper homeostasis protein CutC
MKISSQRVIDESVQLMSEAVHEAAHAVIARVLPSPLTQAREYRVRTLREIITNEEDARKLYQSAIISIPSAILVPPIGEVIGHIFGRLSGRFTRTASF